MSVRTKHTPKSNPQINRMREPYATIFDRVNDRDREFFQCHPGERHYLRPFIPGEHDPKTLKELGIELHAQDSWVLVHRVAPGIRCRQPVGGIVGGELIGGRLTLVFPDGEVLAGVLVVGWKGGEPA